MLSAQLATKTTICAGQFCPFDAEPNSELCQQHIRLVAAGVPVVMHHVDQPITPDPDTHLWCGACPNGGAWLPDEAFNKKQGAGTARRGRRQECRACDLKRRQAYNARLDAEVFEAQKQRQADKRRAERALRRARINGLAT
jgi:hypothetical protein